MSAPHGLTRAQVKALRYFAPNCARKPGDFGEGPTGRTLLKLEGLGLTAWTFRGGIGRDETTAAGLAILAEIDSKRRA